MIHCRTIIGIMVVFVVVLATAAAQGPIDRCGTTGYMAWLQQQNPSLTANLLAIEQHTQAYLAANPPGTGPDVVYTIPVVVHVVYNSAAQNLSDTQIQSQIQVLNEDFRRTNSDAQNTPAAFQAVAADCEIQFCLATRDPAGAPATGITRTQTNSPSFNTNNSVKFTAAGGRDAWPRDQYLNIWVCNLSGGLLGYAQFPGGPASTDGVVLDYAYTGRSGTALAPFNLGRTATHEVGHWLNLIHIWGDNQPACGDDLVADTPPADQPYFGCQTGAQSCGAANMVQNYMDYSDDACMNLYTLGQKARARALFSSGGAREPILSSQGCAGSSCATETGEPNDICAQATAISTATTYNRFICAAGDVDFYQFSLASTQQVTVTLTPPASPCLDYDLQLFSACGTFLAFSANSGCATDTIVAASLAAGTYRVVVVGSNGASSASATYAIRVDTAAPACPAQTDEPNDFCSQAIPIAIDQPLDRYLCPAYDVDWHQFTLGTPKVVTVSVLSPVSPCLDYDVQLFSECGTFLGFAANSGCAAESLAAGTLAAGTYRVVVIGGNGAASGTATYRITVATADPPFTCPGEAGEPNDTCATASMLATNTTIQRHLCPANDLDWHLFTLAGAQDVTVALMPPVSPCLDYDFQLFGACGTFLGFSANSGCATDTRTFTGLPAGTYRVVVIGSGGAFSAAAPYSLAVTATASTGPNCNLNEPNDTCAQATSISTGLMYMRYLCPANDLDWYQFTLAAPTAVTINLTSPANPCLDYDLQLFSSCGTFLGFSANTGCATESLSAGTLSAGTYRVVVMSLAGASSSAAAYTLRVN